MNQEPQSEIFSIPWSEIVGFFSLLGLVVLAWLIGPVVLALAWLIRWWAASESWQARNRWASVSGFAWFFGSIAVILFVGNTFQIPFLSPMLSAIWAHLPHLWDETAHLTLIRWIIALPLSPFAAIVLELIRRSTIWAPGRGLLDSERAQLRAAEEKRQAAAQAKAAQAARREQQRANHQSTQNQSSTAARDRLVTSYLAQDEHTSLQQKQTPVQQGTQSKVNQAGQKRPAPSSPAPSTPVQEEKPKPTPEYDWDQGEGTA